MLSCTKTEEKQNLTSNFTEAQSTKPSTAGRGGIGAKWPLSIEYYVKWVGFYRDCLPGFWYCWRAGSPHDNKSYMQIDQDNQVITFGINNRDSSNYNSQFMYGSDYKFPQDTLNTDVTFAASGSRDMMYVNAGLYHFDIIDSVIIVNVPYFIVQ